MFNEFTLPIIFGALTALAILVYAILDGYDLGVGILLPTHEASEAKRDTMIASIGPFWDANETWLVLAVGLLLIAFPAAHSLVLHHLYLPAAFMLIGLILRGVAFDFRAKAAYENKPMWDGCFKYGSLITALCQGYMLGQYVVGFRLDAVGLGFSFLAAIGVTSAYAYIGATWLVMKTEGALQRDAVNWARKTGRLTFVGVTLVCAVNLWLNPSVFAKWFDFPLVMFVLLIPVVCFGAFIINDQLLLRLPFRNDRYCWLPFVLTTVIFLSCFSALSFGFYPDIVPGQMTIWEAASAPESLGFILWGALLVVPVILLYTVFSYKVFHGKATELKYY